jgi:hypothetical protein
VLPSRSQVQALLARPGVFTHYDEIWLVSDVDDHAIVAKTVTLTSEVDRFQQDLSLESEATFSALQCCLAVGDGNSGLHYVTTDQAFAALIRRSYLILR